MPSAPADRSSREAGRPRAWAAGLSLFLALGLGGTGWLALRDQPYVAPPPAPPASARADAAAASEVLGQLEEAVERRDPAAAAALADPRRPAAAALLRALAHNARLLRVGDFGLRYLTEAGAVGADGSWAGSVEASWRFAGFDRSAAVTEVRFGFRGTGEGVVVTGIGGGDGRSPVWLTGSVQVHRSDRVLVLGAQGIRVGRYARLARAAVPVVRRVLPAWRPRLVVEVPRDAEALDRALGVEPGTYRDIAAVTTSVDGRTDPDAPVHVLVNDEEFARLRDLGGQVVMSHEVTHVATGAATSDMPLWLLEGFADYVALRDVDLPVSTTARQAIAQVRRDGLPDGLPRDSDFQVGGDHLGAVYESAWLACAVLVDRSGEGALVRVFEAVRSGVPVAEALRREAGWTERALVRAWRRRLTDLAA